MTSGSKRSHSSRSSSPIEHNIATVSDTVLPSLVARVRRRRKSGLESVAEIRRLPLLVRCPAESLGMAGSPLIPNNSSGTQRLHCSRALWRTQSPSGAECQGSAVITVPLTGIRNRATVPHRAGVDPGPTEPDVIRLRASLPRKSNFLRKCELLHTRVPRGRLSLWCPGQGLAIFGRANYPLRRRELFAPTNAGVTDSGY